VIPFTEDNIPVLPLATVCAEGVADFADISFFVQDLKEKVVTILTLYHEWISNKSGLDIGDIFGADYRVVDTRRGMQGERRATFVDADSPGFPAPAYQLFFEMLAIAGDEERDRYGQKENKN
jgi:hypothetical protein